MSLRSLVGRAAAVLRDGFTGVTAVGVAERVVRSAAGHTYFCLTDDGVRLRAVVHRGVRGGRPADGQLVRVTGDLAFYAPKGDVQMVVSAVEVAEVKPSGGA